MNRSDFNILESQILSICKIEKVDESKAFIHWILKSYYDLIEPDYYEYVVDGGNDKRIDAFIPFEQDRLIILQARYYKNLKKEISERDIALFSSCLNTLKNPNQLEPKSPLVNVAEIYKEIWNADGEIELHYFTTGKFNKSALDEKITFNNLKDYSGRIQLYFHDLEDLLNTLKSNLSDTNPLSGEKIEFPIIKNQYFYNYDGTYPSYICTIEAEFLSKLYKKYSNSLFDRNIRFYKGSKSGSINAKMIETVGDKKERKNFWYYNNGITIVCNKLELKEKNEKSVLYAEGPQIINGCQTTVSIFEAYEKYYNDSKLPKEINLVVRFIQASPKDTELITLYTNSQNPVSAYQLRSNDDIQKKIKSDLSNFNPPYFYETKEGERRLQKKRIKDDYENRIIEIVQTAQAIYSAQHDPAYARRFKKNLFSDHYSKIFQKDMTPYEVLLPNLVLDEINNHIKHFKNNDFILVNSKEIDDRKKDDIKSKEFLLYSNLIYLYYIWSFIYKRYGRYDNFIAQKLLNNKMNDRVKKMFDYITSILKYHSDLQNTNLQRYLKNKKNIDLLKDELLKEIEKDSAKGKDPLKDFLPEI